MYFLNINKPKGITSFDVVRVLRKKLGIKQIGHSGTLDPLASGVMQVAVGNATKLLDYLDSDKEYIASIKFGYVSTTFDDDSVSVDGDELSVTPDDSVSVDGDELSVTPDDSVSVDGDELSVSPDDSVSVDGIFITLFLQNCSPS